MSDARIISQFSVVRLMVPTFLPLRSPRFFAATLRHDHAVGPDQPGRDADHVDAAARIRATVVPAEPAELGGAGLERGDLGIHMATGTTCSSKPYFWSSLNFCTHRAGTRGARRVGEPSDLAAVAFDRWLGRVREPA